MKNLLSFYISIISPLVILFLLNKSDLISGTLFVGLIFFYALVYRTYTDGKRLSEKNIISKENIWKMIIPGNRLKYFKKLYLK